jgi:peptidyl-prolyl cis-trans isomerase A (cyclophilin A)
MRESTANPRVRFVTELGDIDFEIYEAAAPLSAANFLSLVERGVYDGSNFYRTVRMDNQPNSPVKIEVVQAGLEYAGGFSQYPCVPHERSDVTGVSHLDGSLSLARDEPGTASTEIFICIGAQPSLDAGGARNPDGQGFAAFGRVVAGMDCVRAIQAGRDEGQVLVHKVRIERARRL